MQITVETAVQAPIDKVWAAYTTPADIMQWNAASEDWHTPSATVDLRVGGTFCSRMEAKDGSFGFDFAGIYTVVMPLQRLEYNFFGERTAQIEFSQLPDAVLVKVTFDAEQTHSIDQQRDGWQAILDNFARYTATKS